VFEALVALLFANQANVVGWVGVNRDGPPLTRHHRAQTNVQEAKESTNSGDLGPFSGTGSLHGLIVIWLYSWLGRRQLTGAGLPGTVPTH